MSKYSKDRAFTNYVHTNLAIPLIYNPLDWSEVQLRKDYSKYIDMMDGIDYVFRKGNTIMSVQERFREKQYQNFTDFTIRYRRDSNKIEERHESEYYKMKAHYFTYGIIDSSKNETHKASAFIKYAIIDLKKVALLTPAILAPTHIKKAAMIVAITIIPIIVPSIAPIISIPNFSFP